MAFTEALLVRTAAALREGLEVIDIDGVSPIDVVAVEVAIAVVEAELLRVRSQVGGGLGAVVEALSPPEDST